MAQSTKQASTAAMIGVDMDSELSSFNSSEIPNGGYSSRRKSSSRYLDHESYQLSRPAGDQPRTSVLRSLLVVTVLVSTLVFLIVCLVIPLFNAVNNPIGTLKTMDSSAGSHSHEPAVACPVVEQPTDNSEGTGSNHQHHDEDSSSNTQQYNISQNIEISGSNGSNRGIEVTKESLDEDGKTKTTELGKNLTEVVTKSLTADETKALQDYQLFIKYASDICSCSGFEQTTGRIMGISAAFRTCIYRCMDNCKKAPPAGAEIVQNLHTAP